MDPAATIEAWGGAATRGTLVTACGRRDVDRALREGTITRVHRDRYALPTTDADLARAHALSGALCFTSAALQHGWALARPPDGTHVAVARGRRIAAVRLGGVTLHRFDATPGDVRDRTTAKDVTLDHCLRRLPFGEALAVADSACRSGDLSTLRRVGLLARGPGSAQVRRVAELARCDAANPFESMLRAIALDVPGLNVEPQVLITSVTPWARVDLADRDRRIVLEADSFEWHGHRAALAADARRYDELVADRWLVLRFSWEDVMHRPEWVRQILIRVVHGHTEGALALLRSA